MVITAIDMEEQSVGRRAIEHLEELMAGDPELREEYEQLGPRYAVINEMIRARRRSGLTQAELAERMGKKREAITRLESGENDPRFTTLAEAARAMGMRLDIRFVKERKQAS